MVGFFVSCVILVFLFPLSALQSLNLTAYSGRWHRMYTSLDLNQTNEQSPLEINNSTVLDVVKNGDGTSAMSHHTNSTSHGTVQSSVQFHELSVPLNAANEPTSLSTIPHALHRALDECDPTSVPSSQSTRSAQGSTVQPTAQSSAVTSGSRRPRKAPTRRPTTKSHKVSNNY